MAEQLIPDNFVDEFFLEIVRVYKHPRLMKHHEHVEQHAHRVRATEDSLSQEAQDIQVLQEREIPVPTPRFFSHPTNLGAIPLPPAPLHSGLQIPVPKPIQILDLGRLNGLINDPNVTLIQCDGQGKQIKIDRMNKTMATSVKLNDREIHAIITKFSQRSQSPVTEPVFKAEISPWQITAVVSPINTRFVIVRKN